MGWFMEWLMYNLVGGWATPLTNMKVSWDDEIPNIWEKYNSWSTPPTRNGWWLVKWLVDPNRTEYIYIYNYIYTCVYKNHRIGWRENFNRKPLYIFDGKNHGFRCRFSPTNQSIETLRFGPGVEPSNNTQTQLLIMGHLSQHGMLQGEAP